MTARILDIGGRKVGPGHPFYVIAEAGSNHDGDIKQAFELIDVAVAAGADAVKFQSFSAPLIAAKTTHGIARIDFAGAKSLYELYSKMEMPPEWLPRLYDHARSAGIQFISTPFDEGAVDMLDDLGVPAFKIASFEMLHVPLLRHVASKGKPIILSTGMAYIGEVEEALQAIRGLGNEDVALLHCASNYPAKFENVNLAAMDTLALAFGLPVGYSDHTLGISVPLAVAARGHHIIEKHFTLSRALPGPDHAFSLEPEELKAMVRGIRDIEAAIGSPVKGPAPDEHEVRRRGRRSVFAAADLKPGDVITRDNIAVLRPGVGLPPSAVDIVLGKRVAKAVPAGEPLAWSDFLGGPSG